MAAITSVVDSTALASTTQAEPAKRDRRLVRGLHLWHLLSLDAPSVAMLWTWFLARTNQIALPASAVLAMGVAVWMLYAADRLLDTRASNDRTPIDRTLVDRTPVDRTPVDRTPVAVILTLSHSKEKNPHVLPEVPACNPAELEPRHLFHRRHQTAFRFAILFASCVLASLLPSLAPESIRLYLVLGTLLFGYFVIIHINSGPAQAKTHRLPKELAVGAFFSAAVFIPTVARNPSLRLALIPEAALFAVLCSLNCLFIYTWEHPATSPRTHAATRLALRFLPVLAITAAIAGLFFSTLDHSLHWPIPIACAISAFFLLLLHRNRSRFSPTTLRAAADLCLLTPLLLLRR